MSALHVQNEIGKLKKVLLHCPGPETRNYPDGQFNRVFTLRPSSSSFDLDKALREHHAYSAMLEHEGVEILYLENLLTEALDATEQARRSFIDSYISECGARGIELESAIREYLERIEGSRALAQAAVNGIRYSQVFNTDKEVFSLTKLTADAYSPDDLLVSPLTPCGSHAIRRASSAKALRSTTCTGQSATVRLSPTKRFLPITQISARPSVLQA